MEFFYKILERNAWLEVGLRNIFEVLHPLKIFALRVFNKDKNAQYKCEIKPNQWNAFKTQINALGIKKGDILLVHSSIKGLSTMGVTANEIIDFLLGIVGSEGTLVFPAYPDYETMRRDNSLYYDPKKTVAWTGKLPRTFMEYPNVVRSPFPHNSLAACGKEAKNMMKNNLDGDYSQGVNSAWQYGIERDMKILYLGVKACTSCTIVHYPEDLLGEKWPIHNWFEAEEYFIQHDDTMIKKTIYVRKKEWFKYYKMFNTGYWLKKKDYLKEYDADGVYVGYMDSVKEMCHELVAMAQKGNLLFKVPAKYWKISKGGNVDEK